MKSGVVDIPVRKNDEIEMSFTDLGDKGEGIGRYKGFTVMVPGALPGEIAMVRIVQVRTRFAFGKLVKLIHKSPDRIVPPCPLDGKCGGCQLGHLSYEGQLAYKRDKVKQVLTRIGHFTEEEIEAKLAESTLGMKDYGQEGAAYFHYRNKAQFPVQIVDGKAEAGFYAPRSHRLLPTEDCRIQSEKANELIHAHLFRPPHGWMRPSEYYWLRKEFRVVMWDVVTRDYSKWMTEDGVVNNVKRYVRNGSIITFHDSLKSIDKLRTALPESIRWLKEQGYAFKTIE